MPSPEVPRCTSAEFSLHGWVDESITVGAGTTGAYVLAAVIADPGECEGIRDAFRALRRGRERRLHWRSERPERRSRIAAAVADADLTAVVIVGTPVSRTGQERARRQCMERLLYELDQIGVTQVWLESRTSRLNQQDLRFTDTARRRGTIPRGFRVDFARPLDEPMLWLPDAVAGAMTASRSGKTTWLAQMERVVTQVLIDLR